MHFNKGGSVRYLYCHIFKRLKTGRKANLKLIIVQMITVGDKVSLYEYFFIHMCDQELKRLAIFVPALLWKVLVLRELNQDGHRVAVQHLRQGVVL